MKKNADILGYTLLGILILPTMLKESATTAKNFAVTSLTPKMLSLKVGSKKYLEALSTTRIRSLFGK